MREDNQDVSGVLADETRLEVRKDVQPEGGIRDMLLAVDHFLSRYIETFETTPAPAAVVALRLTRMMERLTPRESVIVEHRVLRTPAKTLKELAAQVGVSSTRAGQIHREVRRKLDVALGTDVGFIATPGLTEELARMGEESAVNRRVDDLLAGIGETPFIVR